MIPVHRTPHHPGARGLVRPRLLADLATIRSVPLTLVVGPAGCGKTTLLAQHAAQFPGPVGWLRLEPGDADPVRLLTRLAAAVPSAPGAPLAYPPETAAAPGLADLLPTIDAALTGDTLLVLDDLHCVTRSASEAVLEQLLVALPARLHVAAGGRRLPGFNLSRHELAATRIIDAEDLRFRAWEVESLLRDVYGEPLPPDDVAALARGVGGWAAGLHLFHLSTRGRPLPERRRAVGALAGRSALTRAYLASTVLADLPRELHQFLLGTCVFDVLTAERCDALLGTTGSQRQLERLERAQAFTTTSDGGRTFVYHAVLRAHLGVALAEQLGDEPARQWHTRAAQILEQEGAATEAVRAYARAEDWDAVRRLLGEVGTVVAAEGMEPWRDLLPAWLVAEDPWLVLAEGRHRLSQGQHEGAMAAFRRAEAMFDTEPGRVLCRAARAAASIWLRHEPGPGTHWGGWLRAAIRRDPAVVVSEAEGLAGPPAVLVRASAAALAGDIRQTRRLLATAVPEDQTLATLAVRLLRATVALGGGDRSALPALATVSSDAEEASMPWLARLARAVAALDLSPDSDHQARTVVAECDRLDDPWGATIAEGIRCLARSIAGTAEPDELAGLLRRCQDLDAGTFEAWAQAMLALASVRRQSPDAEQELHRADRLARTAGVPGARAAAAVAAALTHPSDPGGGRREQAERLLSNAYVAAADAGLPRRAVTVLAGLRDGPAGSPLPPEAPVGVCLFGRFQFAVDGVTLELSTVRPRARAVLRMLTLHANRPVHRDVIIDAFWPETSTAAATRSLHVTLSSLRNLLDAACPARQLLRRDGDAYLLAVPPGGYVDVVAFRAALDRARRARLRGALTERLAALREAVDAYAGELLPEDGPAEWVVRPREELRRQGAEAAAELATAELATGDAAAAVLAAQRCVTIDTCHDRGWRTLVAAYREQGDLAAAERARRDYAEVLTSLGLDPADADVSLASA